MMSAVEAVDPPPREASSMPSAAAKVPSPDPLQASPYERVDVRTVRADAMRARAAGPSVAARRQRVYRFCYCAESKGLFVSLFGDNRRGKCRSPRSIRPARRAARTRGIPGTAPKTANARAARPGAGGGRQPPLPSLNMAGSRRCRCSSL
jgi:hypothetical protein